MLIVGIESSSLVASVALMEEGSLLAEYTTNYKKTHSQTLLPMLEQLMGLLGLSTKEIGAVAVTNGPGSFTGLRIGAATAKGLALALSVPLYSFSTLKAMAVQGYGLCGLICPIMDARRNQVYTACFRSEKDADQGRTGYHLTQVMEDQAMGIAELAETLNQKGEPVFFLGDGVPVYEQAIKEQLTVPFTFLPSFSQRQRAACVAELASKAIEEGKEPGAFSLQYLRLAQAEREKQKKAGGAQ